MTATPSRFIEPAGAGVFENWAARAGLIVCRPNISSTPVDLLVMDDEVNVTPVQLKSVAADGVRLYKKYLGLPLKVVFVFLGTEHGGTSDRTKIAVTTPEFAWQLPALAGRTVRREHINYRFPTLTRELTELLEPFTADTPDRMRELLQH